ncbi:MAG: hypothetical protein NTW14_10725 [bacterium]|nr:hypothetical protein [bacterium]
MSGNSRATSVAELGRRQYNIDQRLYRKYGKSGFVRDGIINFKEWGEAPIKVLWILKEPVCKKGTSYNGRQYWGNLGAHQKYGHWKNTARSMIEVSYGILKFAESGKVLPYNKVTVDYDKEPKVFTLQQVAIINVNKLPGPSRTSPSKLKKAFKEFKQVISKQLKYIDPDIVIGGYTLHLKFPGQTNFNQTDRRFSHEENGKLWLNAYHPAQTKISHEEYYSSIISKAKKWWKKTQRS